MSSLAVSFNNLRFYRWLRKPRFEGQPSIFADYQPLVGSTCLASLQTLATLNY